jgi:hypothetical protein
MDMSSLYDLYQFILLITYYLLLIIHYSLFITYYLIAYAVHRSATASLVWSGCLVVSLPFSQPSQQATALLPSPLAPSDGPSRTQHAARTRPFCGLPCQPCHPISGFSAQDITGSALHSSFRRFYVCVSPKRSEALPTSRVTPRVSRPTSATIVTSHIADRISHLTSDLAQRGPKYA